MNHHVKVVLNISALTVPDKINKSQNIITAIANNAQVFASPGAVLTNAANAINELLAAALAAADGGKSKVALMHDKEAALLKAMCQLAAYVEAVAGDDPAIVHLAGLDIKKSSPQASRSFGIRQGDVTGSVVLTVKPRAKTVYKWQYCKDPQGSSAWTELYTDVSKLIVNNLQTGIYWFKVIFIDGSGEHEGSTGSFAVN